MRIVGASTTEMRDTAQIPDLLSTVALSEP